MRVGMMLLMLGMIAGSAAAVAAQTAPPTNTNTVTGGSSSNTNANSNSQFLSGSNTGVNNGSLEIYAGSEPYQGIIFGGSTNLPQLPGLPAPPSNFSQPYRPDAFVNTPPFLPDTMTVDQAKRCRDAKASWYGGSRDGEPESITLYYAGRARQPPSGALRMANYVGTAMATIADGPFLAALCEAAYRAMRKGARGGLVEFNIRPKNTMMGIGFGASGGATGLPIAGAHPYALAGTLGFGTGWSNQRVEGEVILQLTALHEVPVTSAEPSAAPAEAVTPSAPETVTPAVPEAAGPAASEAVAPTAPEVVAPVAPEAVAPGSSGDAVVPPGPGVSLNGSSPAAAPRVLVTGSAAAAIHVPRSEPVVEVPTDHAPVPRSDSPGEVVPAPPVATPAAPAAPGPAATITEDQPAPRLAYHSTRRLRDIRRGQSKDDVFGVFGSTVAQRDGVLVEIQGMRLRASGPSGSGARLEIGQVSLTDGTAALVAYWFLFSDGRLLAWGRPEQWAAAATRYGVELPYRPSASRVEARAAPASGR